MNEGCVTKDIFYKEQRGKVDENGEISGPVKHSYSPDKKITTDKNCTFANN